MCDNSHIIAVGALMGCDDKKITGDSDNIEIKGDGDSTAK